MTKDVCAPFKILSLLIRCLDNETAPLRQNSPIDQGERLEMDADDCDDEQQEPY
jgi:hypothetical protein